jgi:hypothetical protein
MTKTRIVGGKWWIGFVSSKVINFPICHLTYAFLDFGRRKVIWFNRNVSGIEFMKALENVSKRPN